MVESLPQPAGSNPGESSNCDLPLCVDLDGTLINTDLLWESLLKLLTQHPAIALLTPFWLLKGKANLKSRIADYVDIDAERLPYNEELLIFLQHQHSRGRQLILATASDKKYANRVARYLGLFSNVVASSQEENVSADVKRDKLVGMFGENRFDYVANARVDRAIWADAHHAVLVNASPALARSYQSDDKDAIVLSIRQTKPADILRSLRPHQWTKNFLLFIPLLVSHSVTDLGALRQSMLAFAAFVLCSSAVYLVNDLVDIESDRNHPTKSKRPIAAGLLPVPTAIVLACLLLPGAVAVAYSVSFDFLLALASYFVLTVFYSFLLKKKILLDVLLLAALYTIRIIAGAVAIAVELSFWLLAFSIFLFLSLALVKRFAEILVIEAQDSSGLDGRGYRTDDAPTIGWMGTSSGYISVLVLALYINSDAVTPLYTHPEFLWLVCPAMLYWISLVWFLAGRGQMHEDPVVFATRDHRSFVVGLFLVAIVMLAV